MKRLKIYHCSEKQIFPKRWMRWVKRIPSYSVDKVRLTPEISVRTKKLGFWLYFPGNSPDNQLSFTTASLRYWRWFHSTNFPSHNTSSSSSAKLNNISNISNNIHLVIRNFIFTSRALRTRTTPPSHLKRATGILKRIG